MLTMLQSANPDVPITADIVEGSSELSSNFKGEVKCFERIDEQMPRRQPDYFLYMPTYAVVKHKLYNKIDQKEVNPVEVLCVCLLS